MFPDAESYHASPTCGDAGGVEADTAKSAGSCAAGTFPLMSSDATPEFAPFCVARM